jgi:hypothetical protein
MTDVTNAELPVTVRLSEDGDSALVYDSWIRSYKATYMPLGKRGDIRRLCDRVRAHVAKVLANGMVYVACNPEDTSQVYGWCAVQRTQAGPILHYVYVKRPYRGNGVCHKLLLCARWVPGKLAMTGTSSANFEAAYRGRYVDIGIGVV